MSSMTGYFHTTDHQTWGNSNSKITYVGKTEPIVIVIVIDSQVIVLVIVIDNLNVEIIVILTLSNWDNNEGKCFRPEGCRLVDCVS